MALRLSDEGIYEIKKVVLGNVTLNEYGAKSYWRVVMY